MPESYHSYQLDELYNLPRGQKANERLCQQPLSPNNDDVILDVFCKDGAFPQVGGLAQLLTLLDLDPAIGAGTKLALAAHSTSISMRSTSPINPRVFIYHDVDNATYQFPNAVLLSYVRGEPYIEVAAKHRATGGDRRFGWNFYLLRIVKNCETTNSCVPADFVSDDFEKDWAGVTVHDDMALEDTALSCRRCHMQELSRSTGNVPARASEPLLLFAEDDDPWTHWFVGKSRFGAEIPSGKQYLQTLRDFTGGGYGLIPDEALGASDPEALWKIMYLSFMSSTSRSYRPAQVEREVASNGKSATWAAMYKTFENGHMDPPPHYTPQVTDPKLIAAATDLYQRYRSGAIQREDLPDFRHVFDAAKMEELGHVVQPSATPQATLLKACGQCHNSGVDSSLGRSRFNAHDADGIPAAQKQLAKQRINLPDSDPRKMPPVRFRVLSDSAKAQLNDFFGGSGTPVP